MPLNRIKQMLTGSNGNQQKVLVIGLDCATPQIIFDDLKDEMPNLASLMDNGSYGKLRSVTPPITNPAWYCMTASKTPGTLGAYGFRHRKVGSYTDKYLATHDRIDHDRLWNTLSDQDIRSVAIGVPNTYPPDDIDGLMVTSFLTPDTDADFVHPEERKQEIIDAASFNGKYSEQDQGYMLDIEDFRSEDKQRILDDIFAMTEKKAAVSAHLMDEEDWQFFMTVFMAPDRLHHGFWKYYDEDHKDYKEGNEFEDAIPRYYRFLDKQLGKLLDRIDDQTTVMVVSDHGAKKIDGCICINEVLREEGYLQLKEEPDEDGERMDEDMVDFANTEAWGWGGYYARLFLNVEGREDQGQVPEDEYEQKRDELIELFESMTGPDGEDIGTKVLKPEKVYDKVNGDAPDLMVFFGDLNWRSASTVGQGRYLEENDTGPDHANHDWDGIYIINRPDKDGQGNTGRQSILNIAPTVLHELNEDIPDDYEGNTINH
ncbi:MAG: alkaline phosphatase family protein [Candidatus Nanohaloarchaea archaeon]|nr:alkaline phosphatase family protein [Candidatus Nanohaloarchaea archaeon]